MPVRPNIRLRYTTAPPPPDAGPRARTYRQLIDAGMRLVQQRGLVTVAEVAAAAEVSRATAYRYFPSHSKLITALVEESLGPVRRFESHEQDGHARLTDLFVQTFPRFKEFESQLRAALQLSLEHWALAQAGTLKEEQFRRGHRSHILDRAAAPLRKRLGAAIYARLMRALSVVYGIEPYIVLKDVWNANDHEIESVSRWMLDALINAALRDAGASKPTTIRTRTAQRPARHAQSARRP
jgi:AcrR family transcriptional regulator